MLTVENIKDKYKMTKINWNKEFIQNALSFTAGVAIMTGVITLNPVIALSGALIELINIYNLTNTKETKTND